MSMTEIELDHIAELARQRMDDGVGHHGEQWRLGGRTAINFMMDKLGRHIAAGHQGAMSAWVGDMKTSAGMDYYVCVGHGKDCGEHMTPNVYKIRGRAECDVACWNHLFGLCEAPDILAFDTDEPTATPQQQPNPAGDQVDTTCGKITGTTCVNAYCTACTQMKHAGAVPIPTIRGYAEIRGTDDPDVFEEHLWAWMKGMPVPEGENITLFCALDDAIRYGEAREAAGRADAVLAWFGKLPAPISNPEAWPANYAGGYNDALNMCYDVIRGHAPQPMTTQGEAAGIVNVGTIGHVSHDKGTLTAALTKIGQMAAKGDPTGSQP